MDYYANEGELIVESDEAATAAPCERYQLPYPQQEGGGEPFVSRAPDGTVFAAVAAAVGGAGASIRSSQMLFQSRDGGRSWSGRAMDLPGGQELIGFTRLGDGALLAVEGGNNSGKRDCFHVNRSADQGETWQRIATVPTAGEFENIYGMLVTRLRDDTLLMAAKWYNFEAEDADFPDWPHYIIRSSDGGKTWEGGPSADRKAGQLGPGVSMPGMGGTFSCCSAGHVLELDSGKLLIALRYQNAGRYVQWHRARAEAWGGKTEDVFLGNQEPDEIFKHVFLADSDDRGRTWTNLRPPVDDHGKPLLVYGQKRGQLVQTADGTIVLVHIGGYPYEKTETLARVSKDGGKTWLRRKYHLLEGSGYASSTVLDDGTIVTVAGATRMDEGALAIEPWNTKVIRWRP